MPGMRRLIVNAYQIETKWTPQPFIMQHHVTPSNTNIEYGWIWKQLRNREKCWPENYLTGSSLPMCQRSHCGICGTRSLHWCHCGAQQTLLPRVVELHSHKQSTRTVCICMSNDQPESTISNSSSFMCCQIPETLRGFRSILQMSSASQLQDDVMRRCERQGTPEGPLGSEWRINGRPGRRRLLLHFRCTSKVSLHLAVSRPKMPCMSSWIQILGARTLSLHCFAVSISFHCFHTSTNYAVHFGIGGVCGMSLIS